MSSKLAWPLLAAAGVLALVGLWTVRSGWFATEGTGLLTANGRIERRITRSRRRPSAGWSSSTRTKARGWRGTRC